MVPGFDADGPWSSCKAVALMVFQCLGPAGAVRFPCDVQHNSIFVARHRLINHHLVSDENAKSRLVLAGRVKAADRKQALYDCPGRSGGRHYARFDGTKAADFKSKHVSDVGHARDVLPIFIYAVFFEMEPQSSEAELFKLLTLIMALLMRRVTAQGRCNGYKTSRDGGSVGVPGRAVIRRPPSAPYLRSLYATCARLITPLI